MMGFPAGKRLDLVLFLSMLAGACGGASAGDDQATRTAQILRSHQLATRMAVGLQSTSQVENLQLTATAQVFEALLEDVLSWRPVLPGDFDSSASLWTTGEDSTEYGSSKWTISQGVYRWEVSADQGVVWWSVPDMAPVEDFYLSVVVEMSGNPPSSFVGLVFRVSDDEEQYYIFQLDPQGEYTVYQRKDEGWNQLLPWISSGAFLDDQPNILSVIGQGSTFYFFVNDILAGNITNEDFPSGTAGLAIGLDNAGDAGVWEFQEFQVSIPPVMDNAPVTTP